MKKIAIVITRMVPGGASTVVKQLFDGAKDKYCFILYTGEEDIDENEKKLLREQYNAIFVPSLVRDISPFSDLTAFWRLFREFRKNKFDIVHTHTSKAGILGRYAAILAGIKSIIHTQHGTIYQPQGNIPGVPNRGFRKNVFLITERLAGFWTKYLTVLSKNEYDISTRLKLCSPDKVIIISNGIDTEKFNSVYGKKINLTGSAGTKYHIFSRETRETRENTISYTMNLTDSTGNNTMFFPAKHLSSQGHDAKYVKNTIPYTIESRKLLGIEENECYILSIGRMTAEKGHYVLVEAFRKLLQTTKLDIKLGIVGEGPSKNQIQNENVDLIKSGKLVLYGQDMDIRKYLWAADIFVLPSLYEGFGIAILEAMAVGLPIIASNVGGIPDLVENNINGYLVEPGDSTKLCDCIDKLVLSNETREQMGHENVLKSGFFTLDKMQKKYYELYDK